MQRWIMHIDMDAFFASVEQLDKPELAGKPLIIGGSGERGVVSTASYEARKYGIRSAMPIFQAKKLCPHGIYMSGNKRRYTEVSQQIMHVLQEFSPLVEPASIDEAYLDASGLERLFGPIENLGHKVKIAIRDRTGLTCSVGIAPVKFLAKIYSELKKPDGLSILYPEKIESFLNSLPLSKIPGLGIQTLKKLEEYGLYTAGDARKYPAEFWERQLGKVGKAIYERCHGIDPREVEPFTAPKSESTEDTFEKDTNNLEELKTWLMLQSERVGSRLRQSNYFGKTITLKVKYADFTQITRSHSLKQSTNSTRIIYEIGVRLLEELNPRQKLRLIGIGVSNFITADTAKADVRPLTLPGIKLKKESKSLLPESMDQSREKALDAAMDKARERFGSKAIVRGRLFKNIKN